jgi:hypothetical protein
MALSAPNQTRGSPGSSRDHLLCKGCNGFGPLGPRPGDIVVEEFRGQAPLYPER